MPVDVREYRPQQPDTDQDAILDLFARSFPHAPRSGEHFRWKYRENPFGNERISLAFDGGAHLVGHYAGYAVPFRAYGKDLLAHQIGDTMTDAAVRHIGRGPSSILGRTALHFYGRFCEQRVAFNFGFNVANIQKFSLRFLRSERVEPVTYRVAPPLPPIRRSERWLRGYSLAVVRDTDREWDELFERVSSAYSFCVRRNAAYVRWRYLAAPDVPYVVIAIRKWRHLVGWIAFRIRGNRFTWGDALFDPDFADAPEVLLRHVVPLYPVELIEGWFPPRPRWFDSILTNLGFETRPEPQDLSLMCVPFGWKDVVANMRRDLYYTWGDGDLF
ncbi:MAG TPA: GNAT family N-acetyltransferase [Thermoanaerobaculia bacterium]|nr:GNAT family N-acetyltransferase [Thermoanaerobaculia bacterium]